MRFSSTITNVLFILSALVSSALIAQDTNVSPYSRFGIGDLDPGNFVSNFGMGGTGVGIVDPLHVNPLNPAGLSFLSQPTFEVGLKGEWGTITSATESVDRNLARLNHFAVGFPMDKGRMGAALGLAPLSTIGYTSFSNTYIPELDITQRSEYIGSGGLNRIFLNIARNFTLAADTSKYNQNTRLALGGGLNFEFGSLSTERNSIFPNSNGFVNTKIKDATTFSDVNFQFSTLVRHYLDKKVSEEDSRFTIFNIGATYDLGTALNGNRSQEAYSYVENASGFESARDSINVFSDQKGKLNLPATIAIGASVDFYFRPSEATSSHKFSVAADYRMADWGSTTEVFDAERGFPDLGKLAMLHTGISYQPDVSLNTSRRVSSFSMATYRLGYRTGNTHLAIDNQVLTETGMSFGLSLPVLAGGINRTNSQLDLGVEYSSRGSTDNGLLEENFWRVMVGFSFHPYTRFDRWFQRRKYD